MQFRQELKRLAEGRFTKEDWRCWCTRNFDMLPIEEQNLFAKEATLACAYKRDMVAHNISKVQALGQPIAPLNASNSGQDATGPKADDKSNLHNKLILCRGMKFRLSVNLWTPAGLTNGAIGHVHSIIYEPGKGPPSLPNAIIATFEGYLGTAWREEIPNSVVIKPYTRDEFN